MRNPAALVALASGDIENAIIASTPGGIEAQEAAGQRALVSNFTRLPKEYGWQKPFPKELLERLGFTIGGDADELFVNVTAPASWSMRATDHSMHSDIVDDKGRKRGSVFYKAAFYDRKAHFGLEPRYFHRNDYVQTENREERTVQATVVDAETGAVMFSKPPIKQEGRYFDQLDADGKDCFAFLDREYPDWQNVEAYWS